MFSSLYENMHVVSYPCFFRYNCRLFFVIFPHCEHRHFSLFIYIKSSYLIWARLLHFCTYYYETLFAFSTWYEDVHVVWILLLDYFLCNFFPHCELSHFSPSIYRLWIPREQNSSYNFIPMFLKLCLCFLHSLKLCRCFSYNPCHIFCHFFLLCHFLTSDV